jgi:multicomponent Na+:H+ antiporter subunit F
MYEFLIGSAVIIIATVAAGLARVLRGPGDAERIMAAQLLGTGGVGALLLFGAAAGSGSAVDLALTLALLAAFAAIAFVKKGSTREQPDDARINDAGVERDLPGKDHR